MERMMMTMMTTMVIMMMMMIIIIIIIISMCLNIQGLKIYWFPFRIDHFWQFWGSLSETQGLRRSHPNVSDMAAGFIAAGCTWNMWTHQAHYGSVLSV